MEREIYLDNSATTKLFAEVIEKTEKTLRECYGNPSSLHKKGFEAEKEIINAKRVIADFLAVDATEIYFCSGGTEANNWAIIGAVNRYAKRGKHLITTGVEHPSVLNVFKRFSENGFEVTFLPVNTEGEIDKGALLKALRKDTILVSIMHVNNEIGNIYPIEEIAEVVKNNSNALLHIDAVQSFGKHSVLPKKWGIDLLSISAHKIHGPKGIGALYCDKKLDLPSFIIGGDQESGKRAGTENVPCIAGFAEAVKIVKQSVSKRDEIKRFKRALLDSLSQIPGAGFNGAPYENDSPIISIYFKGINRAEVLMHMLEAKGLYVSTGSACHSRKKNPSHVLEAIGAETDALFGSIRLSLGYLNTEKDISETIKIIKETVQELKHI